MVPREFRADQSARTEAAHRGPGPVERCGSIREYRRLGRSSGWIPADPERVRPVSKKVSLITSMVRLTPGMKLNNVVG
jgi:hypothetical protein